MNQDIFEKAPIPQAVAAMALPTILSMLVTIFYNMADTFFVGQTGDPNQVAAVSLTTPVFLLLMAVGNIFGIGGSSLISRLLGQGEKKRVKNVSSFCFYGGITAGLAMMFLFLLGMKPILSLIGCSSNTEELARSYLTCIAFGSVFVVLSTAFGNIVRGEGAAKIAMAGMMIGTVVNIVLDPIMILAMDMGVSGAAIATVIGNLCSVLFYLFYFWKGRTILSISWKDFKAKEQVLTGVCFIGLPASINNVLMSTSNIIMNNFLAAYGDNPVAAMGVAMKANMLVILLQIGLGTGIQPLIGYNYGSGNLKRLKKIMRFGMLCNVIFGVCITIVYFIFSEPIIRIFIDNQNVIDFGVDMLRAIMLSGPFVGILFVFNFTFQAMGKALPSLILSLSRQGLVFFPVLILADRLIGLKGVVYSQPIADFVAIFMALGMFLVINKGLNKQNTSAAAN